MPMVGDRIQYMGDGNNGTTAATLYIGVIARVTDPGGWGSSDVTVGVGGTSTTIINVLQDTMLSNPGTQPNATWRMLV